MKEKKEHIPVPQDGKSNFYRRLQLDNRTMKLIRNYRTLKQRMDREPDAREVV